MLLRLMIFHNWSVIRQCKNRWPSPPPFHKDRHLEQRVHFLLFKFSCGSITSFANNLVKHAALYGILIFQVCSMASWWLEFLVGLSFCRLHWHWIFDCYVPTISECHLHSEFLCNYPIVCRTQIILFISQSFKSLMSNNSQPWGDYIWAVDRCWWWARYMLENTSFIAPFLCQLANCHFRRMFFCHLALW